VQWLWAQCVLPHCRSCGTSRWPCWRRVRNMRQCRGQGPRCMALF